MTMPPFDNSHYEKACDQAIAMCDGNLRSTIKALIMANEYLEAELTELQVAISSGSRRCTRRAARATPPDGARRWPTSPIMSLCRS
jgi:hypothetical protein